MYQLDGKVYLQTEGGPIGLELSGALARVIMLLWTESYSGGLKRQQLIHPGIFMSTLGMCTMAIVQEKKLLLA